MSSREPRPWSLLTGLLAWGISWGIAAAVAIVLDLPPLGTGLLGLVLGAAVVSVVHEIRWRLWSRRYRLRRWEEILCLTGSFRGR